MTQAPTTRDAPIINVPNPDQIAMMLGTNRQWFYSEELGQLGNRCRSRRFHV